MNSNLIFEGSKVIMNVETFNELKGGNLLNNDKTDNAGKWYLLRCGYAYCVIVED